MKLFTLRGKADFVSVEQVRAFLHASLVVLGYHNWHPSDVLDVRIRRNLQGDHLGYCCGCSIKLRADLLPEDMLTTCLHEVIHACKLFPEETIEKCTSTLCGKLKPDVAKIAHILLENTYQRAAFIAHTKISYQAKGKDHYDPGEDTPVGVKTKYINPKKQRLWKVLTGS